jgi:hypothetical protein
MTCKTVETISALHAGHMPQEAASLQKVETAAAARKLEHRHRAGGAWPPPDCSRSICINRQNHVATAAWLNLLYSCVPS